MKNFLPFLLLAAAGCTTPAPIATPVSAEASDWHDYKLKNVSVAMPGKVEKTADALKGVSGPDYQFKVAVLDGFDEYKDMSDDRLTQAILGKAQSGKMVGEPSKEKFQGYPALRYTVDTPQNEHQDNLHFVVSGKFYTVSFVSPVGSPPIADADKKHLLDSFKLVTP